MCRFFFSLGTAVCAGRGELIHEEPALSSPSLYIVKPPYGLSTPQVYGRVNLLNSSQLAPSVLLASFREGKPLYVNDLEAPAFSLMPEIAGLKSELNQKYGQTMMTGSGTALCCFADEKPVFQSPGYYVERVNFIRRTVDEWYRAA